jgi:DNA-binding NarL/FixJ family response regulator
MVKIFLVDRHPVMRQGLTYALENAGLEVVGNANSAKEALPQIDEFKPDIVIMDAFRSGGDNTKDIKMIQEKNDKAKIFILTDSEREQDFLKAITAGVRGYLLKASEVSQLIDAIQLVAADDTIVYSSKVAGLFDSTLQDTKRLDRLSLREKEILNLVARGYSNREIANRCYVSEATVKAHLRRIAEKMNVKNRAEAVATAIEKGLIEINPGSLDN